MHTALLVLALARPTEVLEEWTLLDTAPLREAITARAVFRRDDGPEIELPAVFSAGPAPRVEVVGEVAPRPVWRVGDRWRARLSGAPGPRSLRVIVRVVRPTPEPRLFVLRWPRAVGEASRRVALVPRGWLPGVPEGWSCADDSVSTLACVSIDTAPAPLTFRVPAAPSSQGERAFAALVALVASAVTVAASERARRSRAVSVAAAWIPAAALALSLVGARLISWAQGACIAALVAAAGGALVSRSERARNAGGVSLVVLSLLAVFDGRPALVAAGAALSLAALVALGRASPETKREKNEKYEKSDARSRAG